MVAAIDPPKMMITACSLTNMCRSPPMNTITAMTAMPERSPTLVMISMGYSDAHAYSIDRPSLDGDAARSEQRIQTLALRH